MSGMCQSNSHGNARTQGFPAKPSVVATWSMFITSPVRDFKVVTASNILASLQ